MKTGWVIYILFMEEIFMSKKKIAVLGLTATFIMTALLPTLVSATVDRWGFNFQIKAYQENTRSAARERTTKNPDNPWTVCLESSGEGKGTKTTFWLENESGKNVSAARDVVQGAGPYKTAAYNDANGINVRLTAENNNHNANIYQASGYWDEEE